MEVALRQLWDPRCCSWTASKESNEGSEPKQDVIVEKLKRLKQLEKMGLVHNRVLLEKQRQLTEQLLQLEVEHV